ncbi:MAG: hypothetical protein WCT77_13235, partial [Bacteroidota bacterium]
NWEGYAGKPIKRDARNKDYFNSLIEIQKNQLNILDYSIHLDDNLIKWYFGGYLDANSTFYTIMDSPQHIKHVSIRITSQRIVIPIIFKKILNINNALRYIDNGKCFTLELRGAKEQRKIINNYLGYVYSSKHKLKILNMLITLQKNSNPLTPYQLEYRKGLTQFHTDITEFRLCKKCDIFYPVDRFRIKDGTKIFQCDSCEKKKRRQYYLNNQDDQMARSKEWKQNLHKTAKGTTKIIIKNLKKRLRDFNKFGLHMEDLLGCSAEKLQYHLQSRFTSEMTWQNYGSFWHIDHIHACSHFDLTDPEQQKICFHYSNLQPLSAIDNMRKSNQLNWTP